MAKKVFDYVGEIFAFLFFISVLATGLIFGAYIAIGFDILPYIRLSIGSVVISLCFVGFWILLEKIYFEEKK